MTKPFISVRIPIEDAARQAMQAQARQMGEDLEAIARQVFAAREHLRDFQERAYITPAASIEAEADPREVFATVPRVCSDDQLDELIAAIKPAAAVILWPNWSQERVLECLEELVERRRAMKGGQA